MGAETTVIPIFPLSDVVLFPRVRRPLHLFEPRYRQMAEDVLAGDQRLGMVTVRPEHVDAMLGDPPVYPIGCAGTVVWAQRRADGRYDIILEGSHRFRIENERESPENRPYRVAEVAPLEDPCDPGDAEAVATLRTRLVELVGDLARLSVANPREVVSPAFLHDVDDATFVNSLSNALPFSTPEKQGLLEADGILKRFDRLEGLLSFRCAQLEIPGQPSTELLH